MERGSLAGNSSSALTRIGRNLQTGTIQECKSRKQLDTEKGLCADLKTPGYTGLDSCECNCKGFYQDNDLLAPFDSSEFKFSV